MKKGLFDALHSEILNSGNGEYEIKKALANLANLKNQKLNILITGPTGSGKSSTINALFGKKEAAVGMSIEPETMSIKKYELDNVILWDTPGLGDSEEKDKSHSMKIISKLNELYKNGEALIDLVLVIIPSNSRDLGSTYKLINKVIIPNLGTNREDRLLIGINKCDMAWDGEGWDFSENKPDEDLSDALEEIVRGVRDRIYSETKVSVNPIYYSAGSARRKNSRPYNLIKLLNIILEKIPSKKRFTFAQNLNQEEDIWEDDDQKEDYKLEVKSLLNQVLDGLWYFTEKVVATAVETGLDWLFKKVSSKLK